MLRFYDTLIINVIIEREVSSETLRRSGCCSVSLRKRNPYEGFVLNNLALGGFLRNEVCEKRDHGTIVPCTGARAFLKRKSDRRRLVAVRRVKHTKTAIEKPLASATQS